MVYYDHDRVMAIGRGKVRDKVNGQLLEGEGVQGGDGNERRDSWMGVDFVLLTDGTSVDEVFDKRGKAWSPEVMFKNSLCAEDTHVAGGRGGVKRME